MMDNSACLSHKLLIMRLETAMPNTDMLKAGSQVASLKV